MKFCCRRLAGREIDHELLWLLVSLASICGAAFWLGEGMPWPRCVFHEITDFPCVTCGATRCAREFFHAHFLAALSWNPLAFFTLVAVALFDVYAFVVVAARLPRLRVKIIAPSLANAFRVAAVLALALNWLYEIHRGV